MRACDRHLSRWGGGIAMGRHPVDYLLSRQISPSREFLHP
jgi:hypothetical protein